MTTLASTLILGWGNPGRLDDGLGPALVRAMADQALPGVTTDSDYQLQVEDAADVARHRRVVFVDADRLGAAPFSIQRIHAARSTSSFSTHSVTPGAVLALTRDLFHAEPEAWLVGIRGYQFDDFGEGLSEQAQANLTAATEFLQTALQRDTFHEIRPPMASLPMQQDHEGDT